MSKVKLALNKSFQDKVIEKFKKERGKKYQRTYFLTVVSRLPKCKKPVG